MPVRYESIKVHASTDFDVALLAQLLADVATEPFPSEAPDQPFDGHDDAARHSTEEGLQ